MGSSSHRIVEEITSSIHSIIERKTSMSSSNQRSSTSSRRERIPDKPKSGGLSLWGFLKSCIGKDLSQIPLPINFNEPLSLLQRLTEELEYSELLDRAASCSSPCEQIAYVAVFIISGYSNNARTTKPFNPLLGETFEFDRMDLGWRIISEQISHHPPISATHCEGNGWIFWQEIRFQSKFTGNDIQITPSGEAYVEFSEGNSFKWNKVDTTVHNFLLGSLWVDHQGVVEIIGKDKAEGIVCKLEFIPYTGSLMRRIKTEIRRVKGEVIDANGTKRWIIEGNCDLQAEIFEVITRDSDEELFVEEPRIAWKCVRLPDGSENYYSKFACEMNEPENGVAPTDSRLRPDQRYMEEGRWEEANLEKIRLEDKQRTVIRQRSESEEMKGYQPVWFEPVTRDDGSLIHKYNGNYWKCKEQQDWSKCPDIF